MKTKSFSPEAVILMLVFIVVIPLLPLLISWRWDWWEAWVYGLTAIVGFAVSRLLAGRRHPDLLSERSRFLRHENPEPWDKILSPLAGLGGGFIPLIAGLDERFAWSPSFSFSLKIVALILILAGYLLGSYALIENRYFSGMVRLQNDRGHRVVTGGPYRWVRHPGYAGALITYLASPVLLDSSWTFIPVIFILTITVIRTRLEDRFLHDRLEGYSDYAKCVSFRLVPGIW